MKNKLRVTSIRVERFEGYNDECYAVTYSSGEGQRLLELANACLDRMSETAPDDGSCHKAGFVVTCSDGNEYVGRTELRRGEPCRLKETIAENVAFMLGRSRPIHMTSDEYAKLCELYAEYNAGHAGWLATFLDECCTS